MDGALAGFLAALRSVFSVDAETGSLKTIDHAHHEIHEGDHYYVQGYIELDDEGEHHVKLVTPDTLKQIHFVFDIQSTGICSSTLVEDATGGMAGGAAMTPRNNNRNSGTAGAVALTGGVSACTGGTMIENDKWGSEGHKENIGGGSARSDELILKRNSVYCRSFISGADDNVIQFKASWYEHTA